MQNITDKEFEREVEALKSHRRISVNRPILDPDLPDMAAIRGGGQEIMAAIGHLSGPLVSTSIANPAPTSPTGSPSSRAADGVALTDSGPSTSNELPITRGAGRQAFTARRRGQATASESTPSLPALGSGRSSNSRPRSPITSDSDTPLGRPSDPSHLFWVPASVHPELSPSHFREFLQEHASRAARERDPALASTGGPTSTSSNFSQFGIVGSGSSVQSGPASSDSTPPISFVPRTSVARRGSTLRRQYRPDNDAEDDEQSTTSQRPAPPLRRDGEPGLSISDLQKLEALAEEATKSRDENELRSVLRRTMSLGAGTSTMDTVDAVPAVGEDGDAPIIVPPPGQILRRAARTKIRKSSMSGSPETAERARRISSSRRRATADQTPAGNLSLDTTGQIEASHVSKPDLTSVAMALMERRPSDTSELSSADEEAAPTESPARPVSDGATDSIVDAYSRDSIISDASQRTSVTSLDESDTVDNLQEKVLLRPSPPSTPTPTSSNHRSGGYFDLALEVSEKEEPAVTSGAKREILSESPLQSPEIEHQPASSISHELRPSNEPKSEPTWPIPVSHIPPVPSFEKARPQNQGVQQGPSSQHQRTDQSQARPSVSINAPILPPKNRGVGTHRSTSPTPSKSRDKEKRSGGFASWFGIGKDEEEAKPSKEEKKREKQHRKERDKDEDSTSGIQVANLTGSPGKVDHNKDKDVGSFLGALFGKKKGHDEGKDSAYSRHQDTITAGSLLDQRGMGGAGGVSGRLVNGHYRYPIHVERAVYRLSHIKLANPRRPLYEQVLISNLMFWYLSIVNRSQQQQQQAQVPPPQQSVDIQSDGSTSGQPTPATAKADNTNVPSGTKSGSNSAAFTDKTVSGSGSLSTASSDGSAPLTVPVEAPSSAAPAPKQTVPQKTKKGGLVKPSRAPGGGRSAEQPILAAGYGAQHQQINNDLAMAQQQQQQQQQQQYSLPSSISVGQIIDARALQYDHQNESSTGYQNEYQSTEQNNTNSQLQRRSASSSSPNTSPRTSPSISAQRIRGSHASGSSGGISSDTNVASNSGAWLGGSGSGSTSSSMSRSRSRQSEEEFDRNNGAGSLAREVDAALNDLGHRLNSDTSPNNASQRGKGDGSQTPTQKFGRPSGSEWEDRHNQGQETPSSHSSSSSNGRRLGYRVGSVGDLRGGGGGMNSSPSIGRGMSGSTSSPSLSPQREVASHSGLSSHRSVSGPERDSASQQQKRPDFSSSVILDAARSAQSRRA